MCFLKYSQLGMLKALLQMGASRELELQVWRDLSSWASKAIFRTSDIIPWDQKATEP